MPDSTPERSTVEIVHERTTTGIASELREMWLGLITQYGLDAPLLLAAAARLEWFLTHLDAMSDDTHLGDPAAPPS